MIVALWLSGCAAPPPPPPPPGSIELHITAAGDINPNALGRASPVSVRVFQLAAVSKLQSSDYFQLADDKVLGRDLLQRNDLIIGPDQQQSLKLPMDDGARFIAVLVSYQAIGQAVWRVDAPLQPHMINNFEAHLAGTRTTLVAGPAEPAKAAGPPK